MALRALPPILFGPKHAYGVPLTGSGTEESVKKLKREDASSFHATWFRPNNGTLIVVGDTSLAEIKPKIEKLFAAWQASQTPQKELPEVAKPLEGRAYLPGR